MEELVKPLPSAQIVGILAQIQKTNYMIDLHRLHDDESMVLQFERQRDAFLVDLRELLATVRIHVDLRPALAA